TPNRRISCRPSCTCWAPTARRSTARRWTRGAENDRPRRTGASDRSAAPIPVPGPALAYRARLVHGRLARLALLPFLLRHTALGQTHRWQSALGAEHLQLLLVHLTPAPYR